MANILSKSGIVDNSTVRTWHVTQSIDAFTNAVAYDITISGSLTVIGDLNLNTNPTGNLIGTAAYSLSSSTANTALSSSTSPYANVSYDTDIVQLYHGEFKNPLPSTIYYFAINIGDPLYTSSLAVGMIPPTNLRILKASLTTTITGTTGSSEPSTYFLYQGNTEIHDFGSVLSHNAEVAYVVQNLNADISSSNKPIYMVWKTPVTWTTSPTFVSHNLVLYCTRGYNPI
jgi:hypothetical protein